MKKIKPLDKILAVDPGKTTGLAFWDTARYTTWEEKFTHASFLEEVRRIQPDLLVCESFVHTTRDGTDYTPVEFIGIVKLYQELDTIPLFEQTPSYGKAYFTDAKLKHLGLYVRGTGHAMDALRHLLQFQMANDMFDLTLLK